MSRVGKKPIDIPQGVSAELKERMVHVKGPKGELSFVLPQGVGIKLQEGKLIIHLQKEEGRITKQDRAFFGLARSLISNMVKGAQTGFEKKVEIEGVGYRAQKQGEDLALQLGYSHPIVLHPPAGVGFAIEKNTVTISGPDKEKVGEFAATIKRQRPVEPYKGKGIRYQGEVVRRKLGKKAAGAAGA